MKISSGNVFSILRQIWGILPSWLRRKAFGQAVLMIVGMALETLSVGLVVPLLALMSRPDFANAYPLLQKLQASLGLQSQVGWVVVLLLAFFFIYLFKTIFLAFLSWRQAWFAYTVQSDLSVSLLATYYKLPYTFHLQRNSAQLVRNVTMEAATVSETLYFGMQLATEMLIFLGLCTLLLIVEPIGAVTVAAVLGIAGLVFLKFTRRHMVAWGLEQQQQQGLRLQHLNQGLAGLKEIKVLGREAKFLLLFGEHTRRALDAGRKQLTLQQFPRLWLELLAIAGLVLLFLSMLSIGRPMDAFLPTLGLFAAAAFRLMPSVNRIINSIQSLQFGSAAVGNLNRERKLVESSNEPVENSSLPPFSFKLEIRELTYRYPNASESALARISMTIKKGEFIGLIGSSGAGKSTLVDVLLGLLPVATDMLIVDGRPVADNLRHWQNQIGYVPQAIYLTDDTLRRNIALGVEDKLIDDEAVWSALRAAQLENFVISAQDGLDLIVGERGARLSGGQRQRIGIARALYSSPELLLLDEATSALDNETEAEVMSAIASLKGSKTVIIIAHRMNAIAHCDRVYQLERGCLVD